MWRLGYAAAHVLVLAASLYAYSTTNAVALAFTAGLAAGFALVTVFDWIKWATESRAGPRD